MGRRGGMGGKEGEVGCGKKGRYGWEGREGRVWEGSGWKLLKNLKGRERLWFVVPNVMLN